MRGAEERRDGELGRANSKRTSEQKEHGRAAGANYRAGVGCTKKKGRKKKEKENGENERKTTVLREISAVPEKAALRAARGSARVRRHEEATMYAAGDPLLQF